MAEMWQQENIYVISPHGDVIVQWVCWYCKYGISYWDLEEIEMMFECGLKINKTTVYR